MDKKLITVLSIPRTGSNYFCNLIENSFTNINVTYELFHPDKCYINNNNNNNKDLYDKISLLYDVSGDLRHNNLHEKIKNDPYQLIKNIKNVCNEENILFKLFLDHLPIENAKEILLNSSLIVFLKRKFLDTFISDEKGYLLKKYSNVDTTNIKIEFKPKHYEKKLNHINKYYNIFKNFILENEISYIEIDYDDFHQLNLKEQQRFLKKMFDIYLHGNNIQMNENVINIEVFKQDRSQCYEDKIENYEEFKKYFYKN